MPVPQVKLGKKKMNNQYLAIESRWLLNEKYKGKKCKDYNLDMLRLIQGEPIDYVIEYSNFLGEKIDLAYRTLIPRTETEYWVNIAINELKVNYSNTAPLCFLDMFSGSGCIGIVLARAFPKAIVYFVDIDDNAIKQINKNINIAGLNPERCKVYKSNMFEGLPRNTKFDAIFANPPYVASKETVASSVLQHEPHIALFAEDNGLFFIKKTLDSARDFLVKNSSIYLEHDAGQEESIASHSESIQWPGIDFNKDQYGNFRWIRAIKGK